MIKLALKHFILETCINTIFNTLMNNFKLLKFNKSIKVGDRFSELTVVKRYTEQKIGVFHFTDIMIIYINYEMVKFRFGEKFIGTFDEMVFEYHKNVCDKMIMVDGIKYYLINTRTAYTEAIVDLEMIESIK